MKKSKVFIFRVAICELIWYLQLDGNPENQIRPHDLDREVEKPVNLKFDFQGSQNLLIGVAISLADIEIQ